MKLISFIKAITLIIGPIYLTRESYRLSLRSMKTLKVEILPPKTKVSNQLTPLYQQAGWLEPSDQVDIVQKIVDHTFAFAVVKLDDTIVAIGRAISDGVSDAYIQDVYVEQSLRGKGFGKMIINKLIEHLQSKKIMWIGLIGNPGTEEFYRPLGFSPMENYIPMKYQVRK